MPAQSSRKEYGKIDKRKVLNFADVNIMHANILNNLTDNYYTGLISFRRDLFSRFLHRAEVQNTFLIEINYDFTML